MVVPRATAKPREAATVMLVRDAPQLEVFMLRRNLAVEFMGGAYVFPGGAVDAGDRAPELLGRCHGRDDSSASTQLGLHAGGMGFWVAAVRETFEEAGVLLAGDPGGGDVVPDVSGEDWEEQRQALLRRDLSLAELLARRGLALRSDLLRPFAHWITPPVEPRRYDTKFFVAALPVGQEARDVSGEADEASWLTPAAALIELAAGTRPMLPPTSHTLGQLKAFPDVAAVLAGSPPEPLQPISPRFEETPDGRWAVLPDGTRIRLVVPLPS